MPKNINNTIQQDNTRVVPKPRLMLPEERRQQKIKKDEVAKAKRYQEAQRRQARLNSEKQIARQAFQQKHDREQKAIEIIQSGKQHMPMDQTTQVSNNPSYKSTFQKTPEQEYVQQVVPYKGSWVEDAVAGAITLPFTAPLAGAAIVKTINTSFGRQLVSDLVANWALNKGYELTTNRNLARDINYISGLNDDNAFGSFATFGVSGGAKSLLAKPTRDLFASTAINYGAKTKELPTNIYKQRRAFNIGTGKNVWDYDPFVEFINSKRDVPSNTSFFHRAPREVDILKIGDGRYRAKGNDYVIHPGGTVDGKFVSYGEPWMEFGTGQNSAWYEFPTSMNKGGRGPYRMATDWRGNQMDYDVTQAYEQMMIRNNPEFQKAEEEYLWRDFNSREEARQAQKNFNEKWGIDPSVNVYDIYHSNQTVIPNKLWNFNSEYPRGFLSQPFWRYTQDSYSGAVQKELMMKPSTVMESLNTVRDNEYIPFIDPETGKWEYIEP